MGIDDDMSSRLNDPVAHGLVDRTMARPAQGRTGVEPDAATVDRDVLLALTFAGIGCFSLDLATQRLHTSGCCRTIYGLAPSTVFTMADMLAAIHPDDRIAYNGAIDDAVQNGTCLELEHRILLADGSERWIELRGQAICEGGRSAGPRLIGTMQDVTDRKRRDLYRTMLANELNHRVKNSFALTQAVIGQTIRSAKSIKEVGNVLDLRLAALAAANDLLLADVVSTATILDVLRRALSPFGFGTTDQIQWAGPDIGLPARLVASLSLALHELATNSSKFGALSRSDGMVRLVWQLTDRDGTPRLGLTWEERGGPPVAAPTRAGFGTTLIERCLGIDVGGFTAIDYRAEGVVFTALLPLDDHHPSPVEPAA